MTVLLSLTGPKNGANYLDGSDIKKGRQYRTVPSGALKSLMLLAKNDFIYNFNYRFNRWLFHLRKIR